MKKTMMTGWLVMAAALTKTVDAVKTMATTTTLAAALLAMTMMTACSSENDLTETPNVEQPAATGIKVTVTAGISDDATTRSAVDATSGNRVLTFTAGDRLWVRGWIDYTTMLAGYLNIDGTSIGNGGTTASFSGEYGTDLKAYAWDNGLGKFVETAHTFATTDILSECEGLTAMLLHADATGFTINENGLMDVTFASMIAPTVEALMTQCLPVWGDYNTTNHSFPLGVTDDYSVCTPIFNCSLSGLMADATYSVQYYASTDGTAWDAGTVFGTVTAESDGAVSFACYGNSIAKANIYHRLRFTNTADGSEVKDLDLGRRELVSKVYNVRRNCGRAAFGKFVDLSAVTTTVGDGVLYYAAQDGDVLSGYFNDEAYITIADGATVTLAGVNFSAPFNCDHAAIHCLGDATIIVGHKAGAEDPDEDYNEVDAGTGSSYPAVYVPSGKTLTISGTGVLNAYGQNSIGAGIGGGNSIDCGSIEIAGGVIYARGGSGAAGIGGGENATCGTITVSGGIITLAQGGDGGAGIGSGRGSNSLCGDILISGGSIGGSIGGWFYDGAVGGERAAGIGCGRNAKCGTITITDGISYVRAAKGQSATYIIGGGSNCGAVTISGEEMTDNQQKSGVNDTIGNLNSNFGNGTWYLCPESDE